jgi:hypothetical protein
MASCMTCGGSGQVKTDPTEPLGVDNQLLPCPSCGGASASGASYGAGDGPISWLLGKAFFAVFALVALVVVGFFALAPLIGLWARADEPLRSIMEALPLGDAVAETTREDGNPGLIAALAGIPLIAFVIGSGLYRRGLIRRQLRGEVAGSSVTAVTWGRAVLVAAWASLVPVLAAMAAGRDLEAGGVNEDSPFDAWWAWAIALVLWGLVAVWDDRRAHERVVSRPDHGDPAPPGPLPAGAA